MLSFVPMVFALSSGGSGSSSVTATTWADVITDVTTQFSITQVVGVMSSIVVAGIGFVFLWWGARKAYRAIMSAVRRGKTGF